MSNAVDRCWTYSTVVGVHVATRWTSYQQVPTAWAEQRQSASSWKTRWNPPLVSWRRWWPPHRPQYLAPTDDRFRLTCYSLLRIFINLGYQQFLLENSPSWSLQSASMNPAVACRHDASARSFAYFTAQRIRHRTVCHQLCKTCSCHWTRWKKRIFSEQILIRT